MAQIQNTTQPIYDSNSNQIGYVKTKSFDNENQFNMALQFDLNPTNHPDGDLVPMSTNTGDYIIPWQLIGGGLWIYIYVIMFSPFNPIPH